VCGYKVAPNRPPPSASGSPQGADRGARGQAAHARQPVPEVRVNKPAAEAANKAIVHPLGSQAQLQQAARAPGKSRHKAADDIYIGHVLNNRFKVESKIGEGGFGAVYRGVQLATGRKVALKLLHPEMTKDENLVARFRREGMVLCNLRDAHTITTYDFDQTPDGTLYIAMELLEGKSLHQLFHEEAPLDWRRVFKILSEMCSSLGEAHNQGIVHRDLKPENIYLESRSGNPEFVKILDFGIAKVMRGDTIDPQSPQLTATGQTLGTLEYMSPEQLMGKQLDGRSDVYALGVLAYEMITGRLPFPEAKGPAGLITAQLKQTPLPPSQANPKAQLTEAADRAILKCLEKDKNNRYPNVSALSVALQQVATGQVGEPAPRRGDVALPPAAGRNPPSPVDRLEARRGEPSNTPPPPVAMPPMQGMPGMSAERSSGLAPMGAHMAPSGFAQTPMPQPVMTPPIGSPMFAQQATSTPYPPAAHGPMGTYPQVPQYQNPAQLRTQRSSRRFVWWVIALLAVGAGVGTALALLFSK
jgi:serine/threonine protein kinase